MRKQKLVLIELKPNKVKKLKWWSNQVDRVRRNEALESIMREGVTREFVYLVEVGSKYYYIGYMQSAGASLSNASACSLFKIDTEHRQVLKECLGDKIYRAELLYDLEDETWQKYMADCLTQR